jgi:uncharacterized protein with HEPN domain
MTQHDDLPYLGHMLDMARRAQRIASGMTRADLDTNYVLEMALERALELIGEAATNVSEEGRAKLDNVPWRKIIDMRNRLIHGYAGIDLEIVWDTATRQVPLLIAELEPVVPAEPPE